MESNEDNTSNQMFVCNIYWGSKANSAVAKKIHPSDLPTQISLDIPTGVQAEIKKKPSEESAIIEQFVYNLLYKKFGYEVNNCQIWLPLKD